MKDLHRSRPWDPRRRPETLPELPQLELRQEEDERKGAGAPVPFLRDGAATIPCSMGRGRVVAAALRPGLLGSRAAAAALARLFGGPGTLLGALFASEFGPGLVLCGTLLWGGIIGAAAVKLLAAPQASSAELPARLAGAGSSGIAVRRPRDLSLGYLANANLGELRWGEARTEASPARGGTLQPASAEPAQVLPAAVTAAVPAQRAAAAQGLAKVAFAENAGRMDASSGLGRETLRDGLAGLAPGKAAAAARLETLGSSSAKARAKVPAGAGLLSRRPNGSGSALGQLKFAGAMSKFGAAAGPETQARQYSTDAFEQARTIGGAGFQGAGDGIVVPPGDGAPGVSDSSPNPAMDQPSVPQPDYGHNATPYQPALDGAKNQSNMAAMLEVLAVILLMLGTILMALGFKLMSNPITKPMGAMVLMIGLSLVILAVVMMLMAFQMSKGAKDAGDGIGKRYGQQQQGDIVNDCADQAYADGTKADQCRPGGAR